MRGAAELSARARGEIAEMLREGAIGRVGIGVDRAGDTLYIALGAAGTTRHVAGRDPAALAAAAATRRSRRRIARGLTHPEVVITAPDGTVREQTPPLRDGVVRGELRCGADGRYQVEIVAQRHDGQRRAREFSRVLRGRAAVGHAARRRRPAPPR